MGKTQVIAEDLKTAMKQRAALKVSVLRSMVASINNAAIEKRAELTEEEVEKILAKEAKKRQEAIELYIKGNRPELADKEKEELQLIKAYLPTQVDPETIKAAIAKMKEAGELGGDFGSAMKAVMGKFKGQADGKLVAELVKQGL